jgi:hypothetical protein
MPAIQKETAVLTGATNDNVLAGSAFEFMRANGIVALGCVASQAGGLITVQAGPDVVLEESPASVKTTMPVVPDDFLYQYAAAAGDRLLVKCRNTAGTTTTFRTVAQVTYV